MTDQDQKLKTEIEQIDQYLEESSKKTVILQKKRKHLEDNLSENIAKRNKLVDIEGRQKKLQDDIQSHYQEIYFLQSTIEELKEQINKIELEKCSVSGHLWVQDRSYGYKIGEMQCTRCQAYNV